jgi:hypothetical protein
MTTFVMKRLTKIGFWNARTLYENGKLKQIEAEERKYDFDNPGVSTVRWNEFGEVRTLAGRTFLYSGRPNEEDPHLEGVGMLLNKRAKCSLIDWKPVSERLMSARFKAKARNVTTVHMHPRNKRMKKLKSGSM